MKKRRADARLVEEMNLESVALARALIMEGRVLAGDRPVLYPGEMLSQKDVLRVRGEIDRYVSRGAHKLRRALEVFQIDVANRVCVDVGASTGGFTEIMLRSGAKKVYAVDVGYNILDYRLRKDARVVSMERVNARFLTPADFPEPPSFGATDVSFISLKAILPAALSVLQGADQSFVALVKPQFEAPREEVGPRGVVRNRETHARVLREVIGFLPSVHWRACGLDFSPIQGAEGNIEFLLCMRPEGNVPGILHENTIDDTIARAYDKFIKLPG